MRIAAIIPLHNKGSDIAAALTSVLMQSHAVDEIVVINDASSDDGAAIVAGFTDPRVQLIHRDVPGPGGYAARNAGIAATRADWLAFLDADDVWQPNHLAVLAALVRAYPKAGCVATRYDHVFGDRREPDQVAGPLGSAASGEVCVDFAGFLQSWLAAGACPLWTGALAIRRDILAMTGAFPEGRAERGGDKDLWLRVVRATPLAFSGRSTADFRREAANKLTDRVDTRRLPCLVPTARDMMHNAPKPERRLLRRLINQEIGLYARWSSRLGGRPGTTLHDLLWPADPAVIVTLAAARYLPTRLLRLAYYWEQRRRAWSRSRRRSTPTARVSV